MVTNYTRCTRKIKFRIATENQFSSRRRRLLSAAHWT